MAKKQNTFEKRRREVEKKRKAAEKRGKRKDKLKDTPDIGGRSGAAEHGDRPAPVRKLLSRTEALPPPAPVTTGRLPRPPVKKST